MEECAILVRNLKIKYRNINTSSLKKSLLEKKKKETIVTAVNDVSFYVKKGEIVGIIGKNGCGKSTLLRAIAGIYSPDEGVVETFGNSVALMAIGVGFQADLTGRENIYLSGRLLGVKEKEMDEYIDEIIEFSELGDFIDRPVSTYSSGMYSKLAFSITVTIKPDIMLLDEVLSVGDQAFKKKSRNKMKSLIHDKNRTVVIVSHSISTLSELCDRMIWMDSGKIVKIGDTEEVLSQYCEYMDNK